MQRYIVTAAFALSAMLVSSSAQAKPSRLIAKCKSGVIKACFDLAVAYENGDLAKTDVPRARELYKRACDAKHAEACANLAVLWQVGEGGAQDSTISLRLHERGCFLGSAGACRAAGKLHAKKAGAGSSARAAFLRGVGCNLGSSRACFDLAQPVQESHPKTARRLFEVACAMGEDAVCASMSLDANAVRQKLSGHGSGAAWRPVDALGWLMTGTWAGVAVVEKKCAGATVDGKACWDAALGSWLGWGSKAELPKAWSYAAKACTAGVPLGCLLSGWLGTLEIQGAKDDGERLLKKACGDKVTAACP